MIYDRLMAMKEYYAAGFYEEPSAAPFVRFSRGTRRFLETQPLPEYHGEPLYPCGTLATDLIVHPEIGYTVTYDWHPKMNEKDILVSRVLECDLPLFWTLVPIEHRVGGTLYTHSFPNYARIVREGLDSYEKRVEQMQDNDLRLGLLDVLAGIRCFHARSLQYLSENCGFPELLRALEKVPFSPAETLYEALVCWNFIYYMDCCDDIGRLDADLIDFYRGEDMTEVIRCLFMNVDANDGWSGSLGPDYNDLTLQCLRACRGIRRPSLELRVKPDMPDEIWEAAIEAIRAGGGSPCLYNEEGYRSALEKCFPQIPKEDRMRWCGGGCTETMLTGMSNVGSTDAGINLALIFERVMRKSLPNAQSFEEFYSIYLDACRKDIEYVLDTVSAGQMVRAGHCPNPMRTLLVDDCIDREKDFNNGGARYTWSVINLAGLINVQDSLLVIRKLVFEDKIFSGTDFLSAMDAGEIFLGYPNIPRHGTDSDEANAMARRLSEDVCAMLDQKTPYLGGKFVPASIQHRHYVFSGERVGSTPDGRRAGEPLCDSIGAIHGNDTKGITAMLNSAAALCQEKMVGTPVLNVKLDASHTISWLKALTNSYFEKGGMQMQVTCINKEELQSALANPEKYPNLIVRIGGYSEYFSRLSPEAQKSVVERTLFSEA